MISVNREIDVCFLSLLPLTLTVQPHPHGCLLPREMTFCFDYIAVENEEEVDPNRSKIDRS